MRKLIKRLICWWLSHKWEATSLGIEIGEGDVINVGKGVGRGVVEGKRS